MIIKASVLAVQILICLGTVYDCTAQVPGAVGHPSSSTLTLRVLSFNIHHGADKTEQDRLTEMATVITKSNADIVGLQEVDINCNRSGKTDQMNRLANLTGMHPAYAEHYPYDGGSYGLGLLSKFPLSRIKNDRISVIKKDGTSDTRALLSATATLPSHGAVKIATIHMALDQTSRIKQAREILQYVGSSSMPVVLTGDLNAEPGTEEIRLLETVFTDTDKDNKLTFPVTDPVKKIDYIFVNAPHLHEVISHQVLTAEKQSDHLPVYSEVNIFASEKTVAKNNSTP